MGCGIYHLEMALVEWVKWVETLQQKMQEYRENLFSSLQEPNPLFVGVAALYTPINSFVPDSAPLQWSSLSIILDSSLHWWLVFGKGLDQVTGSGPFPGPLYTPCCLPICHNKWSYSENNSRLPWLWFLFSWNWLRITFVEDQLLLMLCEEGVTLGILLTWQVFFLHLYLYLELEMG